MSLSILLITLESSGSLGMNNDMHTDHGREFRYAPSSPVMVAQLSSRKCATRLHKR
jgi:hypothetical protein